MVRIRGLEPPHPCEYCNLNAARLPIPPYPHSLNSSQNSSHPTATKHQNGLILGHPTMHTLEPESSSKTKQQTLEAGNAHKDGGALDGRSSSVLANFTKASQPTTTPEGMRAYQREWIRQRRARWLAENGPCQFCGSIDRLEVDHIDPALKISHNLWSWSAPRREAELAKCRVLCYSCHKKRHECSHGTRRRYSVFRCRCAACTLANTLAKRAWRERQFSRCFASSLPAGGRCA